MNLKKNKYGIAALVIVAVAAVHYLFFYEPCKQVTENDFRAAQLACWETYDKANFKEKLCLELKGTQECALYEEEDGAAVEAIIIREIAPCVNKTLKAQNFCEKK